MITTTHEPEVSALDVEVYEAIERKVLWLSTAIVDAANRPAGSSSYFRLTSRLIDQALADVPGDPGAQPAPTGGRRVRAASPTAERPIRTV